MLIYDGHLDLSMNAVHWNRDIRKTVKEIRDREKGMEDKPDRAKNTVSLPAMRDGNVYLCNATLIARYVKPDNPLPGCHSQAQAWALIQGQLAWYQQMIREGEMTLIHDRNTLSQHLTAIRDQLPNIPIGFLLSLEGADSMVSMEHVEIAYSQGLRAIGPSHYGPGVYAQGTDATGGIGKKGKTLLRKMEELGIILDATHLCDDSFREAMDFYQGPVWASHSNARSLVAHNRQFTDEQLKELISRGAVIGAAFDAWMLTPNWIRGTSDPKTMEVSLASVVDQIDYVCQLAGNANHSAIGSDLDGAFGKEQSPYDLETIADLQKIPDLLSKRGFSDTDISNIMADNWVRFLDRVWT